MDPSGKGHSLQAGQRYPQDVKALPRPDWPERTLLAQEHFTGTLH